MYCNEQNIVPNLEQPVAFTLKKYLEPDPSKRPSYADPPSHWLVTQTEWKERVEDNGGNFERDEAGRPLNPFRPTGICDRGRWALWGPNSAVDAGVTKWKRNGNGDIVMNSMRRPIMQFLCTERQDGGLGSGRFLALPGGMKEKLLDKKSLKKELFFQAMARELCEETMAWEKDAPSLEHLFRNGRRIYKGPVQRDPRNTDNAWAVTDVVQVHDGSGKTFAKWNLVAGSDAKAVSWLDYDPDKPPLLFADHDDYLVLMYAEAVRALSF
jgi:ADP-ribose pyrophosphatase YjhB (NUDIX family)